MKVLVTGGAGCIGSELAIALAERGDEVTVFDNLSSGKPEHLEEILHSEGFKFMEGDMLDVDRLDASLEGVEMVWHFAANPDVKFREGDPTDKDLRQNVIATYNLLECMRRRNIKSLAFASTSAVYGICDRLPIAEDRPARPISLYGASKVACETMIGAFQHLFEMRCLIMRLANIVGPKVRKSGQTVISDFVDRLRANPSRLDVLGNGRQAKSYLYVGECIEAMLWIADRVTERFAIYNIGGSDSTSVARIAEIVLEAMGLQSTPVTFSGTEGGWPGDVPRFTLDVGAVNRLGWAAKYNSEQAVRMAVINCLERGDLCRL